MKIKIIDGEFGYINCLSLGKDVIVLEYSIETPSNEDLELELEDILQEYFGDNFNLHDVEGANIW